MCIICIVVTYNILYSYIFKLKLTFGLPQVYYIVCPEVVINFANFSATPTGRELTQIEHATGKCVDNAEVVGGGPPTYLCKGDGKWYLPSGGCKCKAGFEADIAAQTCISKYCEKI